MSSKELITALRRYIGDEYYSTQDALEIVKGEGLCQTYSFVTSEIMDGQILGRDFKTIYLIDDYYILMNMYIMRNYDNDELNGIDEVEPYEELVTKWRVKQ